MGFDVICVECDRPFRWEAPGEKGVEQRWYRLHEHGPKGARCADRGSCKRVAAETQLSLFP